MKPTAPNEPKDPTPSVSECKRNGGERPTATLTRTLVEKETININEPMLVELIRKAYALEGVLAEVKLRGGHYGADYGATISWSKVTQTEVPFDGGGQ